MLLLGVIFKGSLNFVTAIICYSTNSAYTIAVGVLLKNIDFSYDIVYILEVI